MRKIYLKFIDITNTLQHPLLLAIRLYWGTLLAMTGYGKLSQIQKTSSFFHELHIPFPIIFAILVGIIEFLGGVSLILGFLSRFFSLLLLCVFIGAYFTAHFDAVKDLLSTPSLFIKQAPFLYMYAATLILCFGSGALSLDYFLEKRLKS